MADEEDLDRVAEAFASVIDAKSHFTAQHSVGVATYAVGIGEELDFDPVRLRWLRRAALLHDIGKLGASNTILEKARKLTDDEFAEIKRHPAVHLRVAHHERLDGRCYRFRHSGQV